MPCVSCLLFYIVCIVLLPIMIIKLYIKLRTKWCKNKVCLVGKTIIVTGANTGIGYETALEFAKRGAKIILGCRDEVKANEARDRIIKETKNEQIIVKLVDFSSLESVRNFANEVNETEKRLDVLVNNAGIFGLNDWVTKDGLQLLLQVNYFGPFLLTILLCDLLKKSAPSRIVNVSSALAAYSKLDVDKLNTDDGSYHAYSNSKLCNILFTMYLATILEKHNVHVYSLHPGAVKTEIFRKFRGFRKSVIEFFKICFFKSSEEGAQTIIHTATQQGIECFSGRHFEECQVLKTYSTASDPELPKRLWDKTIELLKCDKEIKEM